MSVSLKDISLVTHTNICTVSQVLRNHPGASSLKPEKRARILQAARDLGYCRNEMAASVARKRSSLLVFITSDMGLIGYTGRIHNGVFEAATAHGYAMMILRMNCMTEDELLQKILGWRAAGVIFHIAELPFICRITAILDRHGIPWGTVNLSNPAGLGVTSDDAAGIKNLVEYLHSTGHRRIAYLGTKSNSEYHYRRISGYRTGLMEYYPDALPLIHTMENFSLPGDDSYFHALLSDLKTSGTDAVICEADCIAAALCRTAQQQGLHLPEEFSVTGFGNNEISQEIYPLLTTVEQNFEQMGKIIIEGLLQAINKETPGSGNIVLPVSILHRQSVQKRL